MKRNFIVYPFKMIAGLSTFVVCAGVSVTLLATGKALEPIPFALVAILFLIVGLNYACTISIDDTEIRRSLFGYPLRCLPWDQIHEIGIVGTKVFGNTDAKKNSLFIYISPNTLTDSSRFQMILQWPPKNQLYLEYSQAAFDVIQLHWSGEIKTYTYHHNDPV